VNPILCYPDPPPQDLVAALLRGGYAHHAVARPEDAEHHGTPDGEADSEGWAAVVVSAVADVTSAISFCRAVRHRDVPLAPLLLVVGTGQLSELQLRDDLFDDFCTAPVDPHELRGRLEHLMWRSGRSLRPELVEYGSLVLNLETYQAAVAGRVLDLTYMEYELLRFLSSHPGKVFTRETLLSRVWGYEYYGGARTVDVHVRRLRAKLGEEHAHLIQTVRSVGYRFGQVGWVPATGARSAPG